MPGELIRAHLPCPRCGSHDAAALYSDGHTYCFSCKSYTKGDDKNVNPQLYEDETLEFAPLNRRKLTIDTCRKYRYGLIEDRGTKWQVAEYCDKTGAPAAQHLRGPDKQFRWRGKTEGLQLYGQQLFSAGGKMVVVTEGEIDCLTVSQVQGNKWPVVSVPNGAGSAVKAFKDNLEWLESYEKVIICFDMDEAGRENAQKAAQILSPGKAYIMRLPLKDPSEMLQAGKAEELVNSIWQAAPYRPDGIISGADLWEEIIKPPERGYTTPYPRLNLMTGGVRKKELWLFTAGSGIGKSTVVHEISYHLLMRHRMNIGVMALEESKRRAAERYLSIYLNKPLHISRDDVTTEQLRAAYDATIGVPGRFFLYDHFGSSDLDTLMSRIRYMAVSCAVDFLVLDHISIVVSGLKDAGDNERKQIDVLMTALRSLVEDTGIGVLGVVHLKRPQAGESWNQGKEPGLTDLRGSGGLEQLSDVVVALTRNQKDEQNANRVKLSVLKNRFTGVIGQADELEYSQATGRLTAVPSENSPFKEETDEIQRDQAVRENDPPPPPRGDRQENPETPVSESVGIPDPPLDGEEDF